MNTENKCLSTVSQLSPTRDSIESNQSTVDGVFYSAKYAGEVFKKQGRGNLIITGSISSHVVNVPCDQPVSVTCILAMG